MCVILKELASGLAIDTCSSLCVELQLFVRANRWMDIDGWSWPQWSLHLEPYDAGRFTCAMDECLSSQAYG